MLVVESSVVFRSIVTDILAQLNGDKGSVVFSENDKPMDIQKSVDFIFNPFEPAVNERKLLTQLHNSVKQAASSELYFERTMQLTADIRSFFWSFEQEFPFGIEVAGEVDMGALLKAVDFRYEHTSGAMLENLFQYMSASACLLHARIFAFVNLKSCLTEAELLRLYQEAAYRKWTLFLLESMDKSSLPSEKKLLIDKDMCIISDFEV